MRAHFEQFYIAPEQVGATDFCLKGEEFTHAVRVLRKKPGDVLQAVDGRGHLFEGVVVAIQKQQIIVRIERRFHRLGEPRIRLVLAFAIPKTAQSDWVIEKGTEIGVTIFQPILTERTIPDPSSRLDRWRHKALAAMKQCGRSVLPDVREPLHFAAALAVHGHMPGFLAHDHDSPTDQGDFERLRQCEEAVVYIGPEGGFSKAEASLALASGVVPLSLGLRRLRSDTAALVAITKILHYAGELD